MSLWEWQGGGGGCYQTQREANRWEWECGAEKGKEWKGGEEKICNWRSSELSSRTISPPPPSTPSAVIITINNICLCWCLHHKNHIISLYYNCGKAAQACLITHGGWLFSPGASDVPYPEGRIEFLHPIIYCSPSTVLCPVQTFPTTLFDVSFKPPCVKKLIQKCWRAHICLSRHSSLM